MQAVHQAQKRSVIEFDIRYNQGSRGEGAWQTRRGVTGSKMTDVQGLDPNDLDAAGPTTAFQLSAPLLAPLAAFAASPFSNSSHAVPAAPAPGGSQPLPWCPKGRIDCLNVKLTGNAIVTA